MSIVRSTERLRQRHRTGLLYSQAVLLKEQVVLAPYTTIGIGGAARFFCEAKDEADVEQAIAEAAQHGVELFVLGGGSNLLVADEGFDGLVLRMRILGVQETAPGVFDVGAGEDWDGFVRTATTKNCAGVECLAGIPGKVGGTPVQNVGAYGQEVAETIVSVRAFDRTTSQFVDLPKEACGFHYRKSIFNSSDRDRYIVTRVRFALHPGGAARIAYADVHRIFAGRVEPPSLDEVADAVRGIRRTKGMLIVEGDPDCRSAGSFFKNPIVPAADVERIAEAGGVTEVELPRWPAGPGMVKLPAAWLLEKAGFTKGFAMGRVGVSSRHTLALINQGGATFAEIEALREAITTEVEWHFGIVLEQEPVVLGNR